MNILGHVQSELAVTFARWGVDRFATTEWFVESGLPRLPDAPGWMVCDLHRSIHAGDHLLLFGLVRAASSRTHRPPLVYAHRTFGTHCGFADRPNHAIADLIAACAR